MIDVKNLHKSFGSLQVLRGIDLHVSKGDIISIIGPSGSGKSTLLRSINLLETATKGEIWVDGKLITQPDMSMHPGENAQDIILPQAIKSVMPSLVNEFISLLKNTTLIASIGLVDILRVGQLIQSRTYRAFEPFFAIAVFYYILVMALSFLGKLLERWVNKSDRR